jgi:hypothetical protein
MVLRNVNPGAFEVYDIANNQPTGSIIGFVAVSFSPVTKPISLE